MQKQLWLILILAPIAQCFGMFSRLLERPNLLYNGDLMLNFGISCANTAFKLRSALYQP
jgi:hypothetical protein